MEAFVLCLLGLIYPSGSLPKEVTYTPKAIASAYADIKPRHVSLEDVLTVAAIESAFRHDGVWSSTKAYGLFQIMPGAEADIKARRGQHLDRLVLRFNIEIGITYLDMMYAQFGFIEGALAAYNWGPSVFSQHLAGAVSDMPTETINYITKFKHYRRSCDET
jgi:soluble lytic murein transglycosylase-like protein